MRVPDGRPFIKANQGDVNRQHRKADDVLSRRLDRQPKIPEAAAPPGAAVEGVSLVYLAGLHVDSFAPAYYVTCSTANIEAYTEAGAPAAIPGITHDDVNWAGYFQITEAGVYSFRVITRIALDKAAVVPLVGHLQLVRDAVYNDHQKIVHTFDGAAAGVPNGTIATTEQGLWDDWTIGPQWVQAGERFFPRFRLKLAAGAPAIGPNGGSYVVEVTKWSH